MSHFAAGRFSAERRVSRQEEEGGGGEKAKEREYAAYGAIPGSDEVNVDSRLAGRQRQDHLAGVFRLLWLDARFVYLHLPGRVVQQVQGQPGGLRREDGYDFFFRSPPFHRDLRARNTGVWCFRSGLGSGVWSRSISVVSR